MIPSGPGAMDGRIVRYADLMPLLRLRDSGLIERETFTIIGHGASDSADQHFHIPEKHGFHIGGARQSRGLMETQHSRHTAEVFIVHSGRWRLAFGPNREDGALEIGPGDVASAPLHIYRGVEKLDEGLGFLWTILGEDDPGQAVRAPGAARQGGPLIDTSSGDYQLKERLDEAEEPDAEKLTTLLERLTTCVAAGGSLAANPRSPLATDGIAEDSIIAPRATRDGFGPGPIAGWWPQPFNLRRLRLRSGAYVPLHTRAEAEMFLVHEGAVEASWAEGSTILAAGDVASFPIGMPRAFRNTSSALATIFVVRGADDPALPVFLSAPSAA